MRIKIAAGNWKMNKTLDEGVALASSVAQGFAGNEYRRSVLCVPFVHLCNVGELIRDIPFLHLGAQNCSAEKSGAFTGEVSAEMLASAGVEYVICGHSERRSLYGETDKILSEKVDRILENKMKVIFCCGEMLSERQAGKHFDIVEQQLRLGLFHLSEQQLKEAVIAYEPVWAIGTGVVASDAEAQEMHTFIRGLVRSVYSEQAAENISVLYGGSCNAANAAGLFAQPDVDGGLVGGASLKAEDFLKITGSL